MDRDQPTPEPVVSRIAAWLSLTFAAVAAGMVAVGSLVGAGLANATVTTAELVVLLGLPALIFLLSFIPLFWRAHSGLVRFGIGYLLAIAAIAVGFSWL